MRQEHRGRTDSVARDFDRIQRRLDNEMPRMKTAALSGTTSGSTTLDLGSVVFGPYKVPGIVDVTAAAGVSQTVSTDTFIYSLYVDGASVFRNVFGGGTTARRSESIRRLVPLAANATVTVSARLGRFAGTGTGTAVAGDNSSRIDAIWHPST